MNIIKNKKNIVVVGLGYVGIANAIILAQHNNVLAVDIDNKKITKLNQKISPIKDKEISKYLKLKELNIEAKIIKETVYINADFIIICTPTDYDDSTKSFNTSSVEEIIKNILDENSSAFIIIKSTVPIGFTSKMRKKYNTKKIIFSPEFLREGKALHDNLYPSRIIVGDRCSSAKIFAQLLVDGAVKKNVPKLFISSTEAEASKLFANSFLAMRVAFFNELDSFLMKNNLDSKSIINSLAFDERIGDYYNNPSFGYGGYCLPKDTKQLLSNYQNVPQKIIGAIVQANETRKDFICDEIIRLKPNKVGIYRLIMKKDSDNIRESSMQDVLLKLKKEGIEVVIYEPLLKKGLYLRCEVIRDFKIFATQSDLILTNRMNKQLSGQKNKIFTRDLFHTN